MVPRDLLPADTQPTPNALALRSRLHSLSLLPFRLQPAAKQAVGKRGPSIEPPQSRPVQSQSSQSPAVWSSTSGKEHCATPCGTPYASGNSRGRAEDAASALAQSARCIDTCKNAAPVGPKLALQTCGHVVCCCCWCACALPALNHGAASMRACRPWPTPCMAGQRVRWR